MSSLQMRLIEFLQQELRIPHNSIATALRHPEGQTPHLLPMVLWQYGLVTLEQLDRIFNWLETAPGRDDYTPSCS
ncbi:MAG TPA: DUF2949 domain-containing protein [Candidatus Obscuribacterales bacterium]